MHIQIIFHGAWINEFLNVFQSSTLKSDNSHKSIYSHGFCRISMSSTALSVDKSWTVCWWWINKSESFRTMPFKFASLHPWCHFSSTLCWQVLIVDILINRKLQAAFHFFPHLFFQPPPGACTRAQLGNQMKWEFLTSCNLSSNRVTKCNLKTCFEVCIWVHKKWMFSKSVP